MKNESPVAPLPALEWDVVGRCSHYYLGSIRRAIQSSKFPQSTVGKFRECKDSKPRLLGRKAECYLYARPAKSLL